MNDIQMILLLKLWVQFRSKITSSEKPFIISYRHRENKTFQINQSIVELPVIAAAKLLAEQYSILIRSVGSPHADVVVCRRLRYWDISNIIKWKELRRGKERKQSWTNEKTGRSLLQTNIPNKDPEFEQIWPHLIYLNVLFILSS